MNHALVKDPRQVLLVEDEPRLRDMLLRAIKEMGFNVEGAASAEQAIRLMDRSLSPIVIIDLNLPGAGGLDFLRSVRNRWPGVQAIILTGFGDLDAARTAIHMEVVDFLTKPCALGDLEIALSRAFQRTQKSDRLLKLQTPRLDEQDEDLDEPIVAPAMAFAPREGNEALSIEDVERKAILIALAKHGHNRTAAAEELGISVRKLYYRLAQYQKQGHAQE